MRLLILTRNAVILTVLLLAILFPILAHGAYYYELSNVTFSYESDQTGDTCIGYRPRVDVTVTDDAGNPAPGVVVMGQWYEDGLVALAPNADIEMDRYPRTTDENGETFFAMAVRFPEASAVCPPIEVDPAVYELQVHSLQ